MLGRFHYLQHVILKPSNFINPVSGDDAPVPFKDLVLSRTQSVPRGSKPFLGPQGVFKHPFLADRPLSLFMMPKHNFYFYEAKLCLLWTACGFNNKDALIDLPMFFRFLWSFRETLSCLKICLWIPDINTLQIVGRSSANLIS